MLKAYWKKYTLNFKRPSATSRGVMTFRDSWFLYIYNDNDPRCVGIGECAPLSGLSIDYRNDFSEKLSDVSNYIEEYKDSYITSLIDYPSIQMGLEMALLDLKEGGIQLLFRSSFTDGKSSIPINGLIWMEKKEEMRRQIRQKIQDGFTTIKLKIGGIDFEDEVDLIKEIRKEYSLDCLEIRVDANGAFTYQEALVKLNRLSQFHIHLIEQPIRAGQYEEMAVLCERTPIPIALDEELIGINSFEEQLRLLDEIKPHFIVLKPTLLGGFSRTQLLIDLAKERDIKWWITSALESNIGLNAISQWTATLNNSMVQGLGTGMLYSNNFSSTLFIKEGRLRSCEKIKNLSFRATARNL